MRRNGNKLKRVWKLSGLLLCAALLSAGCGRVAETSGNTERAEKVEYAENAELSVTFLDVGQGNSVLVEQAGEYMLIDGGDRDYASYVVSYLKQRGVENLSYVLVSHYDADHLNGIVGALNAFSCDMVLAPDYVTDSRVYESFYSVVDEKDIELVYPAMGDTYTLGDAEFTVVCPDSYDYADDNDNSIGIRLTYGENSFLICGDAGKKTEEVMVESGLTIDSDVYLASHHGSGGSSYRFFLDAVQPEAVVLSVGRGNSYGHPSEIVLSNIKEMGADLYRTDLQGEIIVTSNGKNLQWNVDACEDYRSGEEIAKNAGDENAGNASPENETEKTEENDKTGNRENGASENAETDYGQVYILNTNTRKFHLPDCSSVADIKEENRAEFSGNREELLEAGYDSCGRCKP